MRKLTDSRCRFPVRKSVRRRTIPAQRTPANRSESSEVRRLCRCCSNRNLTRTNNFRFTANHRWIFRISGNPDHSLYYANIKNTTWCWRCSDTQTIRYKWHFRVAGSDDLFGSIVNRPCNLKLFIYYCTVAFIPFCIFLTLRLDFSICFRFFKQQLFGSSQNRPFVC